MIWAIGGWAVVLGVLLGQVQADKRADTPGQVDTKNAAAPSTNDPQQERTEPIESQPIDAGIVILNGRYVPRPYVLRQEGESFWINGQPVAVANLEGSWFGGRRWRGPDDSWAMGPGGPRSDWQRPRRSTLARMENRLISGAMLLGLRDGTIGLLSPGRETMMLETLLGDEPKNAKVQKLTKEGVDWISSTQWAQLIDTFQSHPDLVEIVEQSKAERSRPRVLPSQPAVSSSSLAYVMTVAALALAVFSLGNLLNHRLRTGLSWREIDESGEDVGMTVRFVVLVVLLGTFDLGCTLLARGTAGFLEINPLGNHLVDSTTALVAFKFVSLVLGATILLLLRRYRGAQMASWWLCLTCTILTLRWAAFNSMFLT